MSRTNGFLYVPKPRSFPHTVTVKMECSVCGITQVDNNDDSELRFVIGPTFLGVPIINRQLHFTEEKNPVLDFKHDYQGEVKVGGKIVNLFLEQNKNGA